jgi:MFS superfamily sulfate permease-like transporter
MSEKKYLISTGNKNKKKTVYRIDKEMSISNIEAVKEEIDEILKHDDKFDLEIGEVENFDLSAAQLLLALKNKLGDNFNFTLSLKKEHLLLLEHTGIDRFIQ